MKYTLLLTLFYVSIYADTPQKVWIITEENTIQTTEGQISSDELTQGEAAYYAEVATTDYNPLERETEVSDISVQNNLEDIPLAKTYPVQELKTISVKKPLNASHSNTTTVNMQQRIDEIKKLIDTQMQKKSALKQNRLAQNPQKNQTSLDEVHEDIATVQKRKVEEIHKAKYFPDKNTFLYILSGLGIILLYFLLYFLFRKQKRKQLESVNEKVAPEESFAMQLEKFYALKAEVRQQFLLRKQNILFNSDFTQYQKAKALNELEKEYTDLEYIYLPKLLSRDFLNFAEAQKELSERLELREIVQDFVESVLNKKRFSKMQKEHIRTMMKSTYKTSTHVWQYDDNIEEEALKEKTYLLQ